MGKMTTHSVWENHFGDQECDQLPCLSRPDVPKELDLVDEVDRASIASMDVKCIRGLNGYRDDGIHSLLPVSWITPKQPKYSQTCSFFHFLAVSRCNHGSETKHAFTQGHPDDPPAGAARAHLPEHAARRQAVGQGPGMEPLDSALS